MVVGEPSLSLNLFLFLACHLGAQLLLQIGGSKQLLLVEVFTIYYAFLVTVIVAHVPQW